ncbi:hypothetical protein C8J56DRAFT_886504 [Mycena floridula]|nr:hypothetical protein C8J56DRAFT_886504 [Mycena floridula]
MCLALRGWTPSMASTSQGLRVIHHPHPPGIPMDESVSTRDFPTPAACLIEMYNTMFFAKNEIAFWLDTNYHMLGVLESPLGFLCMKRYVTALQNRILEAQD